MSQVVLDTIVKEKLISIIRGVPSEYIEKTLQALYEGGIRCVEIAIDHTSAATVANTFTCIKIASEKYGDKLCIGAGTILTVDEVRQAQAAGAQYMISPNTDEAVVKETKKRGLVSLPGAMSPTEVVNAHNWGADIVKIFPAGDLGPKYFKSLRSPLGHIPLMAVGGVSADNLADFLQNGAMGAGIGGNLANVKAIKKGDFAALTQAAQKLVAICAERN